MKLMGGSRKYWYLFRLKLMEYLTFPLDFLANWASFPFTMIVYYFLYNTVYEFNPSFANMTLPTLMVYFFFTLCFRRMGNHSGIANDVNEDIQKGRFLSYITRPMHYIGYSFAIKSSTVVVQALMALPFIIIVPYLVIPQYTLDVTTLLQAYFLALLGFGVTFQIYYMVGLLTFWFEAIWGIRHTIGLMVWLFSGAIVPISILPTFLQGTALLLPFQHQAGIPAQLLLGQKTTGDFILSTIILTGWIIGLFIIQRYVWKKGLQKHDGKG
ncbi:MAG: ABC-2 family transporter protein [Candidatus Diapherotrites archaeon]